MNRKHRIVLNDDECVINLTEPTNLIKIPEIREVKGHNTLSEEQVKAYFEALKDDEVRISVINGFRTDLDNMYLYCDYCNMSIDDDIYYYCYNCHKDMCKLCLDEVISGNPTIGSKNYEKRKDLLNKCKKHHELNLFSERNRNLYNLASCDNCKEIITDKDKYVNDDNYDLCLDCSFLDLGLELNKELIKKNNLILQENPVYNVIDNFYEFGSMLSWAPVLFDDEGNYILFNYDKDSKYCERIALVSMDDHGRCGYYILPQDAKLDILFKRLEEFNDDEEWQKLEGWDKVYNYPIKRLMNTLNMPIHYG